MLEKAVSAATIAALSAALLAAGCGRAFPIANPAATSLPVESPARPSFFRLERIQVPAEFARPYNHTSCIQALPDGELFVVWGAGTRELADDTAIFSARRTTAGDWTDFSVLADRQGRADANCVLFLDDGGLLHLFWAAMHGASFCESTLLQQQSADGGRSWSAPRTLLPTVCTLLKNKPIALRSGRWVLPAYNQAIYGSQFWMSDDRGASWLRGDLLLTSPQNLQPAVVEQANGDLLALMRRAGDGEFTWQGISRDGGVSWSLSQRADLVSPQSGLDLLRLDNGVLIAAYNDSPTERSPLVVRVSLDDGATWLPPRVIATAEIAGEQLSYPSLTQSTDGRIHLTYSDNLEAIGHAEFNLAWVLAE